MPLPSIDVFEGEDVRELVDSLSKMRKELMFVLENLDTANVNGFNAKVINAGVINGKHIHINSDTSFELGYDPEGLRTEMNTQFNVVDGQIQSKVSTETFNLMGARVGTTEASVNVLVGQVALKAESTTVSALGTRVNTAEININGLNGSISQKVSSTDYNGNTIASLINQTATTISIQASKINLVGAVSVLSDISGKLGSITSGNINIYEEARIGAGLYLRGSGNYTGIYFGSTQIMEDSSGWLNLSSRINIGSFTEFHGSVDFSRANVSGLGGGSSATTVRYSSSSKRLYVDLNGVQQGYIPVT